MERIRKKRKSKKKIIKIELNIKNMIKIDKKGDKNKLIEDYKNKESNPPIKEKKSGKRKKNKNIKINVLKTSGDISHKSSKKYDNSHFQIKTKNDLRNSLFNKNSNQKKVKIKEDESMIKFNDYELNILPYEEAIKYDKRNYTQFYFSLLKTKHMLIFSFYTSNDYNSRIIKIYLFFYSFAMYCTVNTLFFSDYTIHQIYEDGGSFNFIYQIPQIIYSFLISSILNTLLKALSLSERSLLYIKRDDKISLDKKVPKVLKCLYFKFIIFFSVSFILLLFFGYYLASFCAIYQNTQFHLFKDSAISFGLSILNPMVLYLIPGIFRIPALRDKKANKKAMYKISQFIQLF